MNKKKPPTRADFRNPANAGRAVRVKLRSSSPIIGHLVNVNNNQNRLIYGCYEDLGHSQYFPQFLKGTMYNAVWILSATDYTPIEFMD